MSPISGYLTPEARATLDAVFAKLAAPGMCNSADDDAVRQRHTLAGRHPGRHPQRRTAQPRRPARRRPRPAGLRRTRSAQRPARQHHRHHHTARTRSRRRQSADRRRHPAADARRDPARPATPTTTWPSSTKAKRWRSITPNAWPHQPSELCCTPKTAAARSPAAPCPATSARSTTATPTPPTPSPTSTTSPSACGPNHKLAEQGWTTRKNHHGHTEWIPPPHLDHGQPRTNTYHHPEKLLRDDDEDDGP